MWVPQGRDRFADVEDRCVAVVGPRCGREDRALRKAGREPVTDFERAPSWMPAALPLLGMSSAVIVLALLAIPVGAGCGGG